MADTIVVARDERGGMHLLRRAEDGALAYLCACRSYDEARAKAKAKGKAWGLVVEREMIAVDGQALPEEWAAPGVDEQFPTWLVKAQIPHGALIVRAADDKTPPPDFTTVLDLSIGKLRERLAVGDLDEHLVALDAAERQGKTRSGALAAIYERMTMVGATS